jgi:mxaJ protein
MSSACREARQPGRWGLIGRFAAAYALLLAAAAWSAADSPAAGGGGPTTKPAGAAMGADGLAEPGVLRVAADPNNLPFSNDRGEGFENKLAELVAQELGAKVEYQWRAQRRGFVRETLKAGTADVMIGVPTAVDMVLATAPYYRSTYVFVSRAADGPAVASFDDGRLKGWKVGVQLTGDSNPPPAYALAAHGLVENVVGFTVYGDYAQDSPPARIVEAVANGQVDAAVVWGPLAGYFAAKQAAPLVTAAVPADAALPGVPFAFNVSMGVAKGNKALQGRLNEILARRRADVEKILDAYHVPRLPVERPATRPATEAAAGTAGRPCDCD